MVGRCDSIDFGVGEYAVGAVNEVFESAGVDAVVVSYEYDGIFFVHFCLNEVGDVVVF